MKFFVVAVLTCLVLALTVNGYGLQDDLERLDHQEERERTVKSKYAQSPSNKLAAQVRAFQTCPSHSVSTRWKAYRKPETSFATSFIQLLESLTFN